MSDISPNWLKVVRRLQSVSRNTNGAAILSIRIVVDRDGVPSFWTEPEIAKIEPSSQSHAFLQLLTRT